MDQENHQQSRSSADDFITAWAPEPATVIDITEDDEVPVIELEAAVADANSSPEGVLSSEV